MITVRAAPPVNMPWIAERAGLALTPDLRVLEAVDENMRIVGQVGFNSATPNAVTCHIALAYPLALRRLLRPAFAAMFDPWPNGYGRQLALAPVLSTNERSLALVRSLGFVEVFRGRDYWEPGVDMVWHEMRADQCRYWSPKVETREAA